ncbi:RIP metalloprotease RseP [Marinilactibacillus psychrotolerans]|uniref:Zinc metalloprotease n=2 Tax=Marinilactibacillus psychrotolerans TaxID=191770 RepID=A0A5R9C5H5_9LACT|nr:RIP metalloprotease RseP [Marinilactibacillus psychrotolerans]TLQ08256.1 RIP metalloprotease RseP [Marinilactibacillus psychrotolerans]GEQ32712.1 metalloprotease RseP [Marinilactibacillus psychrotolerans]SJN38725.1 Membrane-associated zinc metalloprotease [Marinilactibacillus psychrotolerans 42ea]
MVKTILVFLLVFGIIVIVHEFGHFYFAKRAGILVREFSIGFGPKLFYHRKGETTYTVRLLPVGGYVRMAGYEEEADLRAGMPVSLFLNEENKVEKIDLQNKLQSVDSVPIEVTNFDLEEKLFIEGRIEGQIDAIQTYQVTRTALLVEKDGTTLQIAPKDRQFQSASLINRMLTNFAGPLNNFILAIIAFILLAFVQGGVPSEEALVGNVQEDTPAAAANIESGDKILSIDNTEIESFRQMITIVGEAPETQRTFTIEKADGTIIEETITPESVDNGQGEQVGRIGVEVSFDRSFFSKIKFGFTESWSIVSQIFVILGSFLTGGFSIDKLGGPVAIFATSQNVAQAGILGIISFIGFLSVNLGIMNLLPIPALDGGKLLLNIIEGIRKKPISEEKEGILTLIGVGFLLILMLAVTWNDIQTFFLN